MPKMGDAMEEGTLVKWLKSEGDEVSEGDAIAEIETDKVTLELEAENAGTLAQLIADEGQDIPVGEAIAFIQGEGEDVPERAAGGGAQTATQTEAPEREEAPAQPHADGRTDGHFRASPIVRRLAQENNLDLSRIEGSGPAGRIVERDVRAAMESGTAQKTDGKAEVEAPEREAAPQVAAAPEPTRAPGTELVEPSRMRRVIGERMTQSKQQVPHYYATVEVEMQDVLALRKQLNEQLEEQGIKLSINDFVMKAVALALKDFPNLNALWTSEGIELHQQVDLAMAVALEEGLITPVIRDAANETLSAISAASKDLAKRAREGALKPEEYQGGTVTISNMGMFGVESFAAIINPPQAAIVAVSSIMQRAMFKDDEVVPVSIMKLTLSADHRISNGAEGARYLAEVKRLLERPMTLVV